MLYENGTMGWLWLKLPGSLNLQFSFQCFGEAEVDLVLNVLLVSTTLHPWLSRLKHYNLTVTIHKHIAN